MCVNFLLTGERDGRFPANSLFCVLDKISCCAPIFKRFAAQKRVLAPQWWPHSRIWPRPPHRYMKVKWSHGHCLNPPVPYSEALNTPVEPIRYTKINMPVTWSDTLIHLLTNHKHCLNQYSQSEPLNAAVQPIKKTEDISYGDKNTEYINTPSRIGEYTCSGNHKFWLSSLTNQNNTHTSL